MSHPQGALDDAARRGTRTAERGFRSRWTRIVLVEVALSVVLVLAALLARGALHPAPVQAVGTSVTTDQPSPPASATSSPMTSTTSPTRSRTTTTPPTTRTTPPETTPAGPTPSGPTSSGRVSRPSATQVKPDNGPGGTLVDIGGQHLDSVVGVLFGKLGTAVLPGGSAQVIQVMAPKGNAPGAKVAITLETKTGQVATSFVFAYDPVAPTTPP